MTRHGEATPGQGLLALRATWFATRAAVPVSRRLTGRLAGRLWFTPWRMPRSSAALEREAKWLEAARPATFADGRVAGFTAGEGPAVLLVHGWGDRAATLGAFVEPLVASGFRVVGIDLPAHGASRGRETNLYETADAVRAVSDEVGGAAAVVAHSMGGATAALAVRDGMDVERMALLGTPASLETAVGPFLRIFGLPAGVEKALRADIERRFGPTVWDDVATASVARQLRTPALIVHDREDPQVPFDEAVLLAQAWPGARLLTTEGLGHQKVTRDPDVVREVVAFATSARRPSDHVVGGVTPAS